MGEGCQRVAVNQGEHFSQGKIFGALGFDYFLLLKVVGLDLCMPYHPKFPLASQEGGGRPHIWSPPSASPLYSRSCFYSVEILSCCNHTPPAKTRHGGHVAFFSTFAHPQPFFIITSGWDGHHAISRVPEAPKNRFPPQLECQVTRAPLVGGERSSSTSV